MQTSEAKGEAKGAADRASSAASDAADATRRAAGQAADTVRGAAQDAKGAVKGAAQDAKGAVKGAADRAADKARGAGAAAKDVAQDAAAAAQDKADKGFFMWKVSSHPGPAQGLPENHGRQALKTHINLGQLTHSCSQADGHSSRHTRCEALAAPDGSSSSCCFNLSMNHLA